MAPRSAARCCSGSRILDSRSNGSGRIRRGSSAARRSSADFSAERSPSSSRSGMPASGARPAISSSCRCASEPRSAASGVSWAVSRITPTARRPRSRGASISATASRAIRRNSTRSRSWPPSPVSPCALRRAVALRNGERFKLFMLAYLTFRLAVDSVKPAAALGGMSAIQWACLLGIAYYLRFLPAIVRERPAYVAAAFDTAQEVRTVGDKVRPYLFYDVALSICSTCFRKVEAKIVFQDGNVLMLKRCPEHGPERVLMADDVDYYRRCREVFIKPPEMPLAYNTPVKWGCPYDCGLCTDHEQHSCLSLVEINDHCNLRCPICYAESGPDRLSSRTLPEIERMLDAVVRNEGEPDVVQISGGEPTIHPRVLRRARCRAAASDPSPDDQHQRRADRAGRGVRRAPGGIHARLRGLPAVRFLRARRARGAARRRSSPGARARAGTPEPLRHLDHAGRDAEEGAERRTKSAGSSTSRWRSPACAGSRSSRFRPPGAWTASIRQPTG